jgi:hypothetical protein
MVSFLIVFGILVFIGVLTFNKKKDNNGGNEKDEPKFMNEYPITPTAAPIVPPVDPTDPPVDFIVASDDSIINLDEQKTNVLIEVKTEEENSPIKTKPKRKRSKKSKD